jgi:soluble lytic murein transglycosylase
MKQNTTIIQPNRGTTPTLSSARLRFLLVGLTIGASLPSVALAQLAEQPLDRTSPVPLVQPLPIPPVTVQPLSVQPVRAADPLSSAVGQWRTLQLSDNYSFSSYAGFMIAYPGWPGESVFRKNAERMIRADGESSQQVISFFMKFPPQSATAHMRFAEALDYAGRKQEALAEARLAWTSGALTPDDESRMLNRFASAVQPSDQDARMDRLLWDRSTLAAARQLPLTSPTKRAVFDARLAMLTRSADASTKSNFVYNSARGDSGFLADRNWWQRNTGQQPSARDLLAAPRTLSAPPLDPDKWLDTLFVSAKAANTDNQYSTVYNIARQMGDTYPAGTVVSDRPFSERDTYTDLAWLGGQAALNKLGRARDAVPMFLLYANAARSAQTRAKGFYWAGRAAEAAGQRDEAALHYQNAGQYFDQFHGQLALERLRLPIAPPNIRRTVEISGSQRDAFENSALVKAARLLGNQGQWLEQTKFIRAIAATVNSDAEAVLANELAQKLNRPDLAVMIGRNARTSGLGDYLKTAFPQVAVPASISPSWTMIHAISRQESQFDRQIISRAGAKGLMQLMPSTARETAPRAGLSYDVSRLYDPTYNIMLGSTYFGQLMSQYGGSYVLAVAAYNAGPGNVNRWLSANGDPRLPGSDVIGWIEKIPLSETRNYVQRVLENAVVYDMLNPGRANIRSAAPLSAYLGKSQPG